MDPIRDILALDPVDLSGRDLLLYNLAYQIDQHMGIYWTLDKTNSVVSLFEENLDEIEESE
jgi:hypothetical protein